MPPFPILRAWDKGRNTVRYIYKNETGRQVFGEEKFKWYFYVLERQFTESFALFGRLKNSGLIVDFEKTNTKYTKIYVNREHNSESLTINNEPCWEYKDRDLNIVLSKLKESGIKTFEGDLNLWKKWIVDTKPTFENNFKILFLDIETDDENIIGQPIPGEFQIFSISFVDGDTGKEGWLCCKDRTEKAEEEFLLKVAKILNGYDVLCGFNAGAFDFPYIKVRMAKYGIQLDWRKKFLQDHMVIFKKLGPQLPGYSLDAIAKFVLAGEGKVEHGKKIFQLFDTDRQMLKEYNLQDSRLMYKIENKTKFLSVAREINNIGSCSCDDPYISRKIDMLVLQQAHEDQHYHFITMERKWDKKEEEQEEENTEVKVFGKKKSEDEDDEPSFEGAHVFEPMSGFHKSVSVIDFSSLYPNVIKTANISPDTLLSDTTEDQPDPLLVISTPNGQYFRKDYIGILPKLVGKITEGRNRYKNLLKTVDPNSAEHKTYDRLAYAFKAMGLSFYGVCGLKTSRFFDTRVAESITLTGQFFIKKIAEYFNKIKVPILYGDSVDGSRYTVVMEKGRVRLYTFEELFNKTTNRNFDGDKEIGTFDTPLNVLSFNFEKNISEFNEILTVIRHRTNKKVVMYRVPQGITVCTEDHSLIDECGNCFKPSTERMAKKVEIPNLENEDECIDLCLYTQYTPYRFIKKNSELMDQILTCFVKRGEIPEFVFELPESKRRMFFDMTFKFGCLIDISLKFISAFSILASTLGEKINIEYLPSGQYRISRFGLQSSIVLEVQKSSEYVYDLSVANVNNFVDACGCILLHNTDSLFLYYQNVDTIPRLLENIKKICAYYAKEQMNTDECTLEMAYDKGFSELILVTKKRYAGFLTYLDGKFLPEKKLYVAGLEYKRTDACPLLKRKQEELIKLILHAQGQNQQEMINYITTLKSYVFSDAVDAKDFVCAQKLSKPPDKYANPNLMHLKVARQMMKDKKEVYVGDKIPYFIEDIDFEGKPIPRPMYQFRGKLCREYYWSKKIYAALKRVLEVVFKKVPWESFDIGIKVSRLRNTIKSNGFYW